MDLVALVLQQPARGWPRPGSESAATGGFNCSGAPPAGATVASWPGGPAGAATSLAATGNASMSGGLGDGFPDWFNGAASAALGSDWLSSEIGATHAEEESAPPQCKPRRQLAAGEVGALGGEQGRRFKQALLLSTLRLGEICFSCITMILFMQ